MDRFNTAVLMGVLQELRRPASFLLDTFFTRTFEDPSEEIHFDVLSGKRRITPFVHPTRAGKIVDNAGYAAKTFKPAYAKDKRIWNPNAPLKRMAGERIGGNLTPEQRLDALVQEALTDQLEMLTMREEVMASEALRLGQVTVSGDGYESPVVVAFGRDAGHTVTLTSNDRWSVNHADSDPLSDLETWSGLIQTNAGGLGTTVVMAPDSWKNMRTRLIALGQDKMLFDYLRSGGSNAQLGPMAATPGGRYVGTIGSFDLWVYDQSYVDNDGNTQQIMPAGTVILGDANIEGVRAYGAIQDEEAGYTAQRFFTKSWVEKDPAVRFLLLQSAPLVVPTRPNASLAATVL